MRTISTVTLLSALTFVLCLNLSCALAEERYRVLVVQSYEADYLWEIEIREELEKALEHKADLSFFYLNTKSNFADGKKRAEEAYALFKRLNPDGVIAVDDNAQSLFVVPYLKDKTDVPVIFCGVNEDPDLYGYPASNVTGVLERYHFEEILAFNRQIAGRTERFAVMVNKSPLASTMVRLLEKRTSFSAELIAILQPETVEEAEQMAREYREQVDLLLLLTLKGICNNKGLPVDDTQAIAAVVREFAKPTAATAEFVIKHGALSGVLASGQEQGWRAADLLLKAMSGVSIAELPITKNYFGRRMVNVTTMKSLDIVPDTMTLRGVDLVSGP